MQRWDGKTSLPSRCNLTMSNILMAHGQLFITTCCPSQGPTDTQIVPSSHPPQTGLHWLCRCCGCTTIDYNIRAVHMLRVRFTNQTEVWTTDRNMVSCCWTLFRDALHTTVRFAFAFFLGERMPIAKVQGNQFTFGGYPAPMRSLRRSSQPDTFCLSHQHIFLWFITFTSCSCHAYGCAYGCAYVYMHVYSFHVCVCVCVCVCLCVHACLCVWYIHTRTRYLQPSV